MELTRGKGETARWPRGLPLARPRQSAFSLVEILIVIALLGILIAVAAPYLSSDVPYQLQMAADCVAGDLAYTRGLAVANNSSYRVTLDVTANTYEMKHTGSVAALDKLPPSPFHSFASSQTKQIADLSQLPMVAGSVKLSAVKKNPASPSDVTTVEFNSLGATTRAEDTVIWLVSSATGTKMYIPITVNATTGTVDVGSVQASTPSGVTP